jgi:hypothetical protein
MSQPDDDRDREDHQPPAGGSAARVTFLQVLLSTLAAAFGVQSSRNRARDFTHGKALHFIVAGLVFTVLFVVAMVTIVNLVLSGSG